MKFSTGIASVAALACFMADQANAMTANPIPFTVDGRQVEIVGTPWNHHLREKATGYTLVTTGGEPLEDGRGDEKTPIEYHYAVPDSLGNLKPSTAKLGEPVPAGIVPNLTPRLDATQTEAIKDTRNIEETRRRLSRHMISGTLNNIALRIRFKDHINRPMPPDATYEKIMNSIGEAGCTRDEQNPNVCVTPTGSVRELYRENSYSKLDVVTTVTRWVDLPENEAYYGAGCSATCGSINRLQGAIVYALKQLDGDSDFSFSKFDQDGNGYADMFTVFHSGYGAEYGQPDSFGTDHKDRIWSHKYYLNSSPSGAAFTSSDGVRFNEYNINPGVWGLEDDGAPHIGVVAHEMGHFLGLPDLYDTDSSSSGLGTFGLMANSWGFDGTQDYPPAMSPWAKVEVGFSTPRVLGASETMQLKEVHTNDDILKITHGYPSNEYLLIENRQKVSYDLIMPQGGVLVWHIDENKAGSNKNNANEGYPGSSGWPSTHYHVALIQADGKYELEKSRVKGDAGDPFTTGMSLGDNTPTVTLNAYTKIACATATSGLSGNLLEFGAVGSDNAMTVTYTKSASCSCGTTCAGTPTPPPVNTPTPPPVDAPTPAPVGGSCEDDPVGWYDADGSQYNCEWYGAVASRCGQYGDQYENQGKTANQACCVCGGGSDGVVPTPAPVPAVCEDTSGWYDSDGSTYTCAWYADVADRCEKYGNSFENFGETANQACCACGGGSTNSNGPSGVLAKSVKKDPADIVEPETKTNIPLVAGAVVGSLIAGVAFGGVVGRKTAPSAPVTTESRMSKSMASGNPTFDDL